MKDIRVKRNGYELREKHTQLLKFWEEKVFERLDVEYIKEFYFGDRLVMADVKLKDGNYGSFNITEKRISFNGHVCNTEQHKIFTGLTLNDECYKSELF